jgi:hypothetical protein
LEEYDTNKKSLSEKKGFLVPRTGTKAFIFFPLKHSTDKVFALSNISQKIRLRKNYPI